MQKSNLGKDSRENILRFMEGSTDPDIIDLFNQVKEGKRQLIDYVVYDTQAVGAVTSAEFFKPADKETEGYRNINDGKLPSNTAFLMAGIGLQEVASATPLTAAFAGITDITRNGSFKMGVDSKPMFPKITNEVFNEENKLTAIPGIFYLDNPKLIKGNLKIDFEIKLPSAAAANTCYRLFLIGSYIYAQ